MSYYECLETGRSPRLPDGSVDKRHVLSQAFSFGYELLRYCHPVDNAKLMRFFSREVSAGVSRRGRK